MPSMSPAAAGCIAIIPARGGSRRLPNKNIRAFRGRPLLEWTVDAALGAEVFDRVIVTTDSPAIAEAARRCGAEVPFLRDGALADDHTPVSAATVDALERCDPARLVRCVAQLMPNCPLRTAEDVRASHRAFLAAGVDVQLSVVSFGWVNPWWACRREADGRLDPIFADQVTARGQDVPELVCPTGAIWWARSETLRSAGTFHVPGRTGWEIPFDRGVDIDTAADWALAERLAGGDMVGVRAGDAF
jgi:CMP-N-acetylneuraminic acid synthetase